MEHLDEDTLYLAATRPALFAGVPLSMAGAMMMMAGFVIVIFKDPFAELVMLPLWYCARLLVSRDYNAVRIVCLFLLSSGRSLDSADWGGHSLSPHPIRVGSGGRGMV